MRYDIYHISSLRNPVSVALRYKSIVSGGGMVKAGWAVACLLSVVLFVGVTGNAPAADNDVNTPPLPQGVSQAGPEYRIGPEDSLRISVWENRDLTLDLVVRPDGKISMPLIQDVLAEGQTATELANTIHQRLLTFVREPQVSVIVLQVNAPKYFVMGNVTRPGPYLLRSETSILQALSLAGGFTQFASPRSIKLIRNTAGKQQVQKVNYYNIIDEGGEGNFILQSGDTIVVP
jgi:polysaccharide export outer membrane protein